MESEAALKLAELLDREAIRECIYRYCRGIDRLDEAMLKSAYWPDAHEDHGGSFSGNAIDYCDGVLQRLKRMVATHHQIGNVLIRATGMAASVESYFWASHQFPGADGALMDLILAGRYLDRMERRSGEWRIADRQVVFDLFREMRDPQDREQGFLGAVKRLGERCPVDPSYELFPRP